MASETTVLDLPLIDLSSPNLNPGTPEWNLAKSQVQNAIEEFGCFRALFKIPEELQTEIFASLKNIFGLPYETKKRNVSDTPFHGYVGHSPLAPLFESFGFDEPTVLDRVGNIIRDFWSDGNTDFSKTIQQFCIKARELETLVRRMIVESLGLEKYWEEQMNSTGHILRIMKYHAPNLTERKLGLKVHADKNVMTVLTKMKLMACIDVQTKDGSQWIPVRTTLDSFIVIIGESFTAWTNGRLLAPPHGVWVRGYKSRYSLALFSMYKEGYMVKAPKELVDEEHPQLYKPFDYFGFLRYFKDQYNAKVYNKSIKTYAGIE